MRTRPGTAAGLVLALGLSATGSQAATAMAYASLDFRMGSWTCTPPPGTALVGGITLGYTGDLFAQAQVSTTGPPYQQFSRAANSIDITNTSNGVCDVRGVTFTVWAQAELTFASPFEYVPAMGARASVDILGSPPFDGYGVSGLGIFSNPALQAWEQPDHVLDGFSETRTLRLQPGEVTGWNSYVYVTAYTAAPPAPVIPLPPTAALAAGGLGALALAARRRRSRRQV